MILTRLPGVPGLLVSLGLTLGLPAQEEIRFPNDRAGVGAMGLIGRGTAPGEEIERPALGPPRPVYVNTYTPIPVINTPMPVRTLTGSVTGNQSRTADRTGTTPAQRAGTEPVDRFPVQPALARTNRYSVYHRGWLHGFWNARVPNSLNRRGPGRGMGWGIAAWLVGPMVYNWAYFPYHNPYSYSGPDRIASPGHSLPVASEGSHPINPLNAPSNEAVLRKALECFQAARASFRREDYTQALRLADRGVRLMPDDPELQEFRALALFALHHYREAAETLYAVLAVVPGWDWTTMINFYENPATYTRQLRILESFSDANPNVAAAHFVRAYHYLSLGAPQAAVLEWKRSHALQPDDSLAVQLIQELEPSKPGAATRVGPSPVRSTATAGLAPAGGLGKLEGTWTAHPGKDTTLTVTFQPQGHLVWIVNQSGHDRTFKGKAIVNQQTLTLVQDQDNAMVGEVAWQGSRHFTFKLWEGPPGDPGLTFTKAP